MHEIVTQPTSVGRRFNVEAQPTSRGIFDSTTLRGNPPLRRNATPVTPVIIAPHSLGMVRISYIDGALPYGRRLRKPMFIAIEQDDAEILVSEPYFHMHAGGMTVEQAIAAFKRVISGYLDVLAGKESRLSEHLRDQLEYLRSFIVTA